MPHQLPEPIIVGVAECHGSVARDDFTEGDKGTVTTVTRNANH